MKKIVDKKSVSIDLNKKINSAIISLSYNNINSLFNLINKA